MADGTKIEWSDATWQIITGCSVLSPGCSNCYAMKLAGTRLRHHPSRAGLTAPSKAGPVWTGEVRFNEQWLDQPLKWTRPRDIFVCAHGDLFHESVPDEWINKTFAVMAVSNRHRFQVLTKRSERMRDYCSNQNVVARIKAAVEAFGNSLGPNTEDFDFFAKIGWQSRLEPCKPNCRPPCSLSEATNSKCYGMIRWDGPIPWPLPNVWLGISAERQKEWDERKGDLAATPAAVRFASFEPLLGPIIEPRLSDYLSWAIVGGESGDGARPMHPDWPRQIRDQCAASGVPYFFKQHGEWLSCTDDNGEISYGRHEAHLWGGPEIGGDGACYRVGKKSAGRLLDGVEHNGMPGDQP